MKSCTAPSPQSEDTGEVTSDELTPYNTDLQYLDDNFQVYNVYVYCVIIESV